MQLCTCVIGVELQKNWSLVDFVSKYINRDISEREGTRHKLLLLGLGKSHQAHHLNALTLKILYVM